MRTILAGFLLALGACHAGAAEPPDAAKPWPLWDGKETVAEYAKRTRLEPTMSLRLKDKVTLDLVLIPAGKFLMGSPETEKDRQANETQHEVTITKPFYMGKYEVTQEQYEAIIGKNPSHFKGANLPVEKVSWNEAQEFCKRVSALRLVCFGGARETTEAEAARIKALIVELGSEDPQARQRAQDALIRVGRLAFPFLKELLAGADVEPTTRAGAEGVLDRICAAPWLPTEAEWEYACRAGTETRFHAGDTYEDLKAVGWCPASSGGKTHPVGEKQPNAFGLYDMHGNVWEWCQDRYADYEAGAAVDPQGPAKGTDRVVRGGSWFGLPRVCRSAYRGGYSPGGRLIGIGFRVALDVK